MLGEDDKGKKCDHDERWGERGRLGRKRRGGNRWVGEMAKVKNRNQD